MNHPTDPLILAESLCFAYRQREILHNVSFRVNRGDFMAIVGPNGGGKTTLLHLILGLIRPQRGSIRVFNSTPETARSRIGYVPQHLVFDSSFPVTALDVVKTGLVDRTRFGFLPKRDLAAATHALIQTGCESFMHRPFPLLSGGERQRVLIARALACDPELLLLDEPTANVDPQAEHEIYQLFREINRNKTIVFVSHNLNVVTRHVNRILCVNHSAAAHPIAEVMTGTFTELYGGELALLQHDTRCHITDPSKALQSPHEACSCQHHS